MDNVNTAIFIHELRNQCLYAETSFNIFNQFFEQKLPIGIFYSAQSTLLAASQISSMLWPVGARSRKRGDALRSALKLDEKHPLNNNKIKSVWEKGDEKLEQWVQATKGRNVIIDHIGPVEDLDPNNYSEANVYRLYDPKTSVFFYRGYGYNMQVLANALADIYTRVTAVHQALFPDQYKNIDKQVMPPEKAKATTDKPKAKAKKKAAPKKPAAKPSAKPAAKVKAKPKK